MRNLSEMISHLLKMWETAVVNLNKMKIKGLFVNNYL